MPLPPAGFEPSPRMALFAGLLIAGLLLLALLSALLLRHRPGAGASPLQRVARNSLFPMATSFLNKFLDLGFAVYVLRTLGPEGVGQYTFAVVVLGYLDILANFGLGTLLTREVARHREASGRYLGNTLAARLALWAVSLAVVALLLGPASRPMGVTPEVGLAIALLALGLLPSLVASTCSSLFMAHEKFEYPAVVTVFTTLIKIALGVTALSAGLGIVGLAGVSIVVNLVTLVALVGGLGWLQTAASGERRVQGVAPGGGEDAPSSPAPSPTKGGREEAGPGHATVASVASRPGGVRGVPKPFFFSHPSLKIELDLGFCLRMLRSSYPLMLNNLLNSVFFRVDSLLLKPMAGDLALGWYGTAYKFVDGLGIISSSLTLALFPVLSQYARSSPASLARAFGLAIKLLLMVSLPISAGVTLIAPEIILLVAGPEYLPHSALALQILIWFLPFSFVNGVTQYLLIAIDQQRFITLSFLIATAFNLVANLLLIPPLGYLGAAITTVLSEWILMIPFWYCVRRHLPPIPLLRLAWRPVVASAVMGLEVAALRDWNLPLAILLAPPIYAAGLLALRSFVEEEREMLAGILPGRLSRRLGLG